MSIPQLIEQIKKDVESVRKIRQELAEARTAYHFAEIRAKWAKEDYDRFRRSHPELEVWEVSADEA